MKFSNNRRFSGQELGYNIETRVPDWIGYNRSKLVAIIADSFDAYLKAHTDPVVYDQVTDTTVVYIDDILNVRIPVKEVPLIKKTNHYTIYTEKDDWFDKKSLKAVEFLKRLDDVEKEYTSAPQGAKKKIYNSLFTDNSSELDKLIEEELLV